MITKNKRIKPMQSMDENYFKKRCKLGYEYLYTLLYKAREKKTINIYYRLSTTFCLRF